MKKLLIIGFCGLAALGATYIPSMYSPVQINRTNYTMTIPTNFFIANSNAIATAATAGGVVGTGGGSSNISDSGYTAVIRNATVSTNLVVTYGSIYGDGTGLSNVVAGSGISASTATNIAQNLFGVSTNDQVQFRPVTNGAAWRINSGTGAANSDGSYDETFNIGWNYDRNGSKIVAGDYQLKWGLESNYRQSNNTNYWEWNLDYADNAGTTNARYFSAVGSFSNHLANFGFAGNRHIWTFDKIGGTAVSDWIFSGVANSNTFDFDGRLSADYLTSHTGEYITNKLYRTSSYPIDTTLEYGQLGWDTDNLFAIRTMAGSGSLRGMRLAFGTNSMLEMPIAMTGAYFKPYTLQLGYGAGSTDVSFKSTDGEIYVTPGGSSKRIILNTASGVAVNIQGGLLRLNAGTPIFSMLQSGGGKEIGAIGAGNASLTSMQVGLGAVAQTYGPYVYWDNDEFIMYGSNNVEAARITTNRNFVLNWNGTFYGNGGGLTNLPAGVTASEVTNTVTAMTNGLATTASLNSASNAISQLITNHGTAVSNGAVAFAQNVTNNNLYSWASQATNAYRTIWIDAGAMSTNATGGPSVGFYSPTNFNNPVMDVWDFDAATAETNYFKLYMPDDWDNGTVKVKFFYFATSETASTSNVWAVAGTAITTGDTFYDNFGTEVSVTNAVQTATNKLNSCVSPAITVGNTPALGDLVMFRLRRVADSGWDNAGGYARLTGVALQYQSKRNNPAVW